MRLSLAAVVLALVSLVPIARAQSRAGFVPVPAVAGEKAPTLSLAIVKYDGSTNGEISVRVKNTGKEPQRFFAQGLYFVPQVATDRAPQRLGAVGPMQAPTTAQQSAGSSARVDDLTIAPGATVDVKLDVFCIDSHRASPTSETPFALAGERLPAQLAKAIDSDARKAADSVGGFAAPAAKSTVQGEVWKRRDEKWVPLEGEGTQEAGK